MLLARARIVRVGPFTDSTLSFGGEAPRLLTVIYGGGGTGKSSVLSAIAATRPGHAVVQLGQRPPGKDPSFCVCDFVLGEDDPARPHPLTVVTPNVRLSDDDAEASRRREQILFDKLARESGFAFLALSAARWHSRQPIAINAPLRTVARYDVTAQTSLDDAGRADLGRETKQALTYAAITSALAKTSNRLSSDHTLLGQAMRRAVNELTELHDIRYVGIDPASLEPEFETPAGDVIPFDRLPNRVRHLVSFAALPVRVLWAAYPGRDPRQGQGVFAIDQVELHQDAGVQTKVAAALKRALPAAQWILTTASPTVAMSCERSELIALRRDGDESTGELSVDDAALLH